MAKIYKFPSGELINKPNPELDELEYISNQCIESSQFLMDVIEEFVITGQTSEFEPFMNMNFREEAFQESRDIFVIVNLLNAMFQRYMGIPHKLHRTLDRTYIDIKALIKQNKKARKEIEDLKDDTT